MSAIVVQTSTIPLEKLYALDGTQMTPNDLATISDYNFFIYRSTKPHHITSNGVSSVQTSSGAYLKITNGTILARCNRQWNEYRRYHPDGQGEYVLKCHYATKVIPSGHDEKCACGFCQNTFDLISDFRTCGQTCTCCSGFDDPGEEQCVVM